LVLGRKYFPRVKGVFIRETSNMRIHGYCHKNFIYPRTGNKVKFSRIQGTNSPLRPTPAGFPPEINLRGIKKMFKKKKFNLKKVEIVSFVNALLLNINALKLHLTLLNF
jgi:hypothetical protein